MRHLFIFFYKVCKRIQLHPLNLNRERTSVPASKTELVSVPGSAAEKARLPGWRRALSHFIIRCFLTGISAVSISHAPADAVSVRCPDFKNRLF